MPGAIVRTHIVVSSIIPRFVEVLTSALFRLKILFPTMSLASQWSISMLRRERYPVRYNLKRCILALLLFQILFAKHFEGVNNIRLAKR